MRAFWRCSFRRNEVWLVNFFEPHDESFKDKTRVCGCNKFLKLGCLFFSHFIIWNWRPLSLKSWHFEASEDIMTKFKSQVLYIIRIKYWNAGGSSNPPSLIPTLWNLGILLIKRPPAPNNMKVSVSTYLPIDIGEGFPLLFKGVITEFFRWDTAYVVGVTFSLWLW